MSSGPDTPQESARSAERLRQDDLPSEAARRLGQMSATGSWTSDLSVQEFAALRSCGFQPVGQVLGTAVMRIGYRGYGGCVGAWGAPAVAGTGHYARSSWSGYKPLVDALYAGRKKCMTRIVKECTELGGDGVVGIKLRSRRLLDGDTLEFQALGTAVRSTGRLHMSRPFTAELSGQDFAKLLMAGWMPYAVVSGVAVGVRHDDWQTRSSARSWSNVEVPGYTQLVQETRAQVRAELAAHLTHLGASGMVTRPMHLRIRSTECGRNDNARDHVAEATMVGTALVRFTARSSSTPPAALRILRLDQQHEEVLGGRLVDSDTRDPWRRKAPR